MATWVQCTRYDEQRSVIWINLDQVVSVREHENGSTFLCAVRDGESPFEIPVWDRLHDIAFAKAGSDA